MNWFKTIWGFLFRLFPCPIDVGLYRIGRPNRKSPVLVTCNFYLTVQRLKRRLRGLDAWLLVADSKGDNVWCGAAGGYFSTHSVVSALKTSGIAEEVDHRELILPPLAAAGVRASDLEHLSGWSVSWGPVRMKDIARFLQAGGVREEHMKRVSFSWSERLDAAAGSLFVPYLIGGAGFAAFGRHLLADYLLIGAAAFFIFFLTCPFIPGKKGITKVMLLCGLLAFPLGWSWVHPTAGSARLRAVVFIAMGTFLMYGFELGGIASNMASELDPLLARIGVRSVGNLAFAGSIRTDLLNRRRRITIDRRKCIGCRSCIEVCPQGVWEMGGNNSAFCAREKHCTACRACLIQCRSGAIHVIGCPSS